MDFLSPGCLKAFIIFSVSSYDGFICLAEQLFNGFYYLFSIECFLEIVLDCSGQSM